MVSSVCGDMSHLGPDDVGLASLSPVSFVFGEVAHKICHHGHTIVRNAKSCASFSTTCSSNGTLAPEPGASCQPVVCPQLTVVPNTLLPASTGLFSIGDTSPECTLKHGYSIEVLQPPPTSVPHALCTLRRVKTRSDVGFCDLRAPMAGASAELLATFKAAEVVENKERGVPLSP